MAARSDPEFAHVCVDELSIADEVSFRGIELYADLKEILRRDRYTFRVLPRGGRHVRWDRALFLNLTFWGGQGGDVLESRRVAPDVIAHAAWHHLAVKAIGARPGARQSVEALFLGESIASAFDVYLVGRLLTHRPSSPFLATQVPAMAEAARAAGLPAKAFAALLRGIAADPARAFADLRALLYDASLELAACRDAGEALASLERFGPRRFAPLLHHYEISNWVLYARAYAGGPQSRRARALEKTLAAHPLALAWLSSQWIAPALDQPEPRKPLTRGAGRALGEMATRGGHRARG